MWPRPVRLSKNKKNWKEKVFEKNTGTAIGIQKICCASSCAFVSRNKCAGQCLLFITTFGVYLVFCEKRFSHSRKAKEMPLIFAKLKHM